MDWIAQSGRSHPIPPPSCALLPRKSRSGAQLKDLRSRWPTHASHPSSGTGHESEGRYGLSTSAAGDRIRSSSAVSAHGDPCVFAKVFGWGDLRSNAAVREFVHTRRFVTFTNVPPSERVSSPGPFSSSARRWALQRPPTTRQRPTRSVIAHCPSAEYPLFERCAQRGAAQPSHHVPGQRPRQDLNLRPAD